MQIKNNAQILVVDDHYNEVKNLLMALSKNGLSYVYNNGSYRMRPRKSNLYTGVRFIILDTDIKKLTSDMTPENKASTLVTYLTEIISENNGPIFILFCTKDATIIEEMKKNFARSKFILAGYDTLDKDANGVAGHEALTKLHAAINSNSLPQSFKFFLSWEQNVSCVQSLFVNSLSVMNQPETSDFAQKAQLWNKHIQNILCKLIMTNTGGKWQNVYQNKNNLAYAIDLLNQSFAGKLPKHAEFFDLPEKTDKLSLDTIAKINSELFLTDVIEKKKIETGRIYYDKNDYLLDDLKKHILKDSIPADINVKLITAVITPQCDIAQTKFLKSDSRQREWHNFLSGLEIEIKDNKYRKWLKKDSNFIERTSYIEGITSITEDEKNTLKGFLFPTTPNCIYMTFPLINNEGRKCIWVFHFATVMSKPIKKNSTTFHYQMSRELFFDLQSKLANHLNRLGNSMLEC